MIASNLGFFITEELDADYSSEVFAERLCQWTAMSWRQWDFYTHTLAEGMGHVQ